MSQLYSSRFSDYNRRQALLAILLIVIGFSYVLTIGFLNPDCTPQLEYPPEAIDDPLYGNDSLFYRRIIQQVHDGKGYYDVANIELRQHGFFADSVFNWRLPTYAWVFGALPRPFYGHMILIVLAVIALALVFASEQRNLPIQAAAFSVALIFGVFNCFFSAPLPDLDTVPAVLFQESWACVLITISVSAYGLGWNAVGVCAGLSALFWRELVLPYCVIAAGLSLWRGQRKETLAWCVGLALFGWFFISHLMEISRRLEGTPSGMSVSRWIVFAGLRFHFFAMNVNGWLSKFPGWAMASYLSLSLIGLAGWKGKQSSLVGLTVTAYLLAFCVIGKTLNCYWGMLYSTLLPFGVVRGPFYLWQLVRIAVSNHKASGSGLRG